jgi:hypothetical protein
MRRTALSSLRRLSVGAGLAAALAACGTAASTRTSSPSRPASPVRALTVSPSTGAPTTVFELHFSVPVVAAPSAGSKTSFELGVSGPQKAGCLAARAVAVPSAAGTTVDIPLNPGQLGGRWCAGSYQVRVDEVQRPVCSPGTMCPQFIRVVATVARVSFRVVSVA